MHKSPRIFFLLHIAHSALFRSVDRFLKDKENIASAHQVILFVLAATDGLTSAQVAKQSGHSKSRLTGLVDKLEKMKLVERRTSKHDRRVHTIHILQPGRELVKRTSNITNTMNRALLKDFNHDEQQVIERFLKSAVARAKDRW